MRNVRRSNRVVASFGAVLLVAALAIPAGAASSARVRLAASASDLSRATFVRASDTSETVDIQVVLGWNDEAGAKALLASVSDPTSPNYRQYVSPEAFRAQFSKSDADVSEVSSWLSSQGFRVGAVPDNHLYVPATGTVQQANSVFNVTLGDYNVDGTVRREPDTAPSVPASLDGIVEGVNGLTDVTYQTTVAPPAPAFITGRPCSAYWSEQMATTKPRAYGRRQPFAPCGYSAAQLQGAYGTADAISGGNDGSGVTVAVVDAFASPSIQQDLNEYSSRNGIPSTDINQITQPPLGTVKAQQGWWVEETIDIESVHAMAPGANLLFWGAQSPKGVDLDAALVDIVDNHRADIITNSYGNRTEQVPQSTVDTENDIFLQAGAEGIGTYFASGDEGDNKQVAGYRTVEWPASSPYVTGVGGTSLGVGSTDAYLFETGWGTYNTFLSKDKSSWKPAPPGVFWYAGTGGTSRISAEPDYQMGVVPDSLSGFWGGSNRVVPDVAMDGDPNTGFTIVMTYTFPNGSVGFGESRYGGTSLSSPLFAGTMALADDAAGAAHGFANPVLYSISGSSALRDIVDPSRMIAVVRTDFANGVDAKHGKAYSLRSFNQTDSLHTTPGYDDVTGVGTPNGQAFLDALDGP